MAKDKTKKKNKTLKKIILVVVITLLGTLLIVAGVFLGKILKLRSDAKKIMSNVSLDSFRQTETSIIYDINGKEISALSGIKELYYLESDEIPDVLKKMFVQIEDKDFYNHSGIDMSAIIRAALANVTHSSIRQGASTITQQLAKNMFLDQSITWNRKITEMFIAMELEKRFSKDQILEFYINNIYFANGYYGIEAASEGYFGKPVSELNVSQLAFLAGIPRRPNAYDPFTNYDAAVERRNSVLKQLYAAGLITSLEYYEAIEYDIVINSKKTDRYNYVETYVFYCATRALMEQDGFVFRTEFTDKDDEDAYKEMYDSTYAEYQKSLFTGGYRIYTAIDMEKQELLQNILNQELKFSEDTGDNGIYDLQGAAVCIDNETGLVTAIVGGRTQEYDGYMFNRAYQAYRQPGSAIKPVLVYAPYLIAGHMPDEIIDDSYMPGGPKNVDDTYRGLITLTEALGYSTNVPAWKIMESLTPETAIQYLHAMNYAKINDDEHNMAISVGGFTYGVSPVELAAGYATLENNGTYRNPTCVSRITNSKGENIVNNPGEGYSVYTKDASIMVTKMMEWGVNHGILQKAKLENAIVAAKSGTTNDYKDGWLAGYSKYYTTVVWVGCDQPKSVLGLGGGTFPLNIWKKYMEIIHEGLPLEEFPDYQDNAGDNNSGDIHDEKETETHPGWHGGGTPNISDGDTPHGVDVSGRGDKDVDVSGMGDKDYDYRG